MAVRRALHPSGKELIFESRWHKYTMNGLGVFDSVTGVLDRMFPFDRDRISQAVADKTNRTVDEVLTEWRMSAQLGTNTHAYLEALIKNQTLPTTFDVEQGNEPFFCEAAAKMAKELLSDYEPLALEYMVCHPPAAIAGTVDFIGKHKETGRVLVCDWKTSSTSADGGYKFGDFDEGSPHPLLSHLVNGKMNRYALQIFLYGHLLQSQGYHKLLKEPRLGVGEPLEYMVGLVYPRARVAATGSGIPTPPTSSECTYKLIKMDLAGVLAPIEAQDNGTALPPQYVLDNLLGVHP